MRTPGNLELVCLSPSTYPDVHLIDLCKFAINHPILRQNHSTKDQPSHHTYDQTQTASTMLRYLRPRSSSEPRKSMVFHKVKCSANCICVFKDTQFGFHECPIDGDGESDTLCQFCRNHTVWFWTRAPDCEWDRLMEKWKQAHRLWSGGGGRDINRWGVPLGVDIVKYNFDRDGKIRYLEEEEEEAEVRPKEDSGEKDLSASDQSLASTRRTTLCDCEHGHTPFRFWRCPIDDKPLERTTCDYCQSHPRCFGSIFPLCQRKQRYQCWVVAHATWKLKKGEQGEFWEEIARSQSMGGQEAWEKMRDCIQMIREDEQRKAAQGREQQKRPRRRRTFAALGIVSAAVMYGLAWV